jgi:hypothetical protein
MHKDYAAWIEQEHVRHEAELKKRAAKPSKPSGDWMSIFDAGDAAIADGKKQGPGGKAVEPSGAGEAAPADPMSLFDAGDAAIQDTKKRPAPPKPPAPPPAPPKK